MSALEGTPLDIALRDCGIDAFAVVGIVMEIGIEPTVWHGADLGYIPMVVKDKSGFGHRDAAEGSIASLEFAGDALLTDIEALCAQFSAHTTLIATIRREAALRTSSNRFHPLSSCCTRRQARRRMTRGKKVRRQAPAPPCRLV
jgi:hypothetical protein